MFLIGIPQSAKYFKVKVSLEYFFSNKYSKVRQSIPKYSKVFEKVFEHLRKFLKIENTRVPSPKHE